MSRKPSVAVFGASGVVGGNMAAFLATKAHLFSKLSLHDINPGTKYHGPQGDFVTTDRREDAKGCDIAFICVPTPERADGSADTSIVEDVCSWGDAEVFVVRSTVPPGTCEEIERRTGRDIAFQPEYLGENPSGNAYNDIGDRKWVTLGGPKRATMKAAAFYTRLYPADCRIMQTDFRTAEMVKYMTNTFLAMKTVYCAEMARVCEAHGVDYMAARELWLMDERIGRSHTSVYQSNPGYSGKCISPDEFVFLPDGAPMQASDAAESPPPAILSIDPETNNITTAKVDACRRIPCNKIVRIKLRTGRRIDVAPYHPCWVERQGENGFRELDAVNVRPSDKMAIPLGAADNWATNEVADDFEAVNLTQWALSAFRGMRVSYHVPDADSSEIVSAARAAWKGGEITEDKWLRAKKWAKSGRAHEQTLRRLGHGAARITVSRETLPLDITLDRRWAALAGYYCAEGSSTIRRKETCVAFSFHKDERAYIDEVSETLRELGFRCYERHSKRDKVTCVVCRSSFLAKFLSQHLGCGRNCYEKAVPGFVFRHRGLAQEFLQRYFAGDGNLYMTGGKYPNVSAASASRRMIEGIDSLLRKESTLPIRKFRSAHENASDIWHVQVSHKRSLDIVSGKLLLSERLTAERDASAAVKTIDSPAYELRGRCAVIEVTDVSTVANAHGYVISLETSNHLYVTSGGVAVHNCFPKDTAAIIRSSEKLGFEPKLLKSVDARNDELRAQAGLGTGADQLA